MSLATQLVRAAIEAGAPTFVRDLRTDHLPEDERPVVEFVKQHLTQHGQLPTLHTLAEHGFPINRVRETASYYADEIKNRYVFSAINDRHPALAAAMREKNGQQAIEIVREMALVGGSVAQGVSYVSLADEANLVLEDYEYAKAHPGLRGITYGWPTLDELTLGMQPGDLDVTSGRPGKGKSWLQQENAYSAWRAGHGIAIITMEMPSKQYATRWVGRHSGLNPRFLRSGQLSIWGERHLRTTIVDIQNGTHAPVHIMSGDFNKGVEGIEALLNQVDAEAIYVDAAYLLSPKARMRGAASRWEELSSVMRELKQLSLSKRRPVSITVQLNRNVKGDSQKDVDLGDIGGTDTIPQDASTVRAIKDGRPPFQSVRRYIQNLKNREGETTDFEVHFRHKPIDFSEAPMTPSESVVSTDWMI